MSKVNVADYLINSLAENKSDDSSMVLNRTIERIVDVWSKQKYITPRPRLNSKQDQIIFGDQAVRITTNC